MYTLTVNFQNIKLGSKLESDKYESGYVFNVEKHFCVEHCYKKLLTFQTLDVYLF